MMKLLLSSMLIVILTSSYAVAQSASNDITLANDGAADVFRFQSTSLANGDISVKVWTPNNAGIEDEVTLSPGGSAKVFFNQKGKKAVFIADGTVSHDRRHNVVRFSGRLVIPGVAETRFQNSPVVVVEK
ncbi:MAG: hypothetical protein AAFX90_17115 [Pseudomonadota bacterium]